MLKEKYIARDRAAAAADTEFAYVVRALDYLECHWREQPGLEETARAIGLSPYHFQRLFKHWAGISPKRFLQFLTVEYAKTRLRAARSILDTALDSGLSGPSRLHDLFIAAEAMTPGAYRRRGAGVSIRCGIHDSTFGPVLIARTDLGVCGLHFADDEEAAFAALRADFPDAALVDDADATRDVARCLERPGFGGGTLKLAPRGTNFELKVWSALLQLPPGTLASYGDIAKFVGTPGASRAVGRAVGANPISLLIPCHRVIQASGALGNYGGGPMRKRAIVGWEAAHLWREQAEPGDAVVSARPGD
ncbi:MAG: methylated-DNA--[protein]-cysteine S-methyltransferase [Ectothiorhodospiraceae bacterium]|jgi:AraC family transcriptional regulator of adaptative response/methylated-DNA-[protein]-cysteine methyltransferase